MPKLHTLSLLLAALAFSITSSTSAGDASDSSPKVLLFGTFHFKDAGLDMVKVDDIDISSETNQAYLEGLTDRLAAFGPTVVLLEYGPDQEEVINQRYRDYLSGDYELGTNEIYQLGFRIAKKAGLERVHSFDHRDVPWQIGPVATYGQTHEVPAWKSLEQAIAEFQAEEAEARKQLSFAQLLARQNDPERDRLNRDLYLATNAIGVDEDWIGATATTSWWERNFRMYARVQQHAVPGARIIAIGGSGHMAILKPLLATDTRMVAEDPRPYLQAPSRD